MKPFIASVRRVVAMTLIALAVSLGLFIDALPASASGPAVQTSTSVIHPNDPPYWMNNYYTDFKDKGTCSAFGDRAVGGFIHNVVAYRCHTGRGADPGKVAIDLQFRGAGGGGGGGGW